MSQSRVEAEATGFYAVQSVLEQQKSDADDGSNE